MPYYSIVGGSLDGTQVFHDQVLSIGQIVQWPAKLGSNASESYQLREDGKLYVAGYGDKPLTAKENSAEQEVAMLEIASLLSNLRGPLAALTRYFDQHGYPPPVQVDDWLLTRVQKRPAKNDQTQR